MNSGSAGSVAADSSHVAGPDVSDDVLLARAFLSRAAEPANIPLWALVRQVGPVEAVERLRSGEVDGALAGLARRVASVDPHADLEAAQRHGARLLVPEGDQWPHFAFAALERTGERRLEEYGHGKHAHADRGEDIPPLALWARGPLDPSSLGIRSVALVGGRAATPYGDSVAAELGYGLALREFAVVSGGAFGIDAAAHRGALAAAGNTVIVSAGGVDRPYPAAHARLFDRTLERGAVLSETPVGAAPRRARFLTRNRLIAALGTGTVVVEASARSGALNTAGHAERLGRPVMAVPGPVTSAMSIGCHQLIGAGRCQLVGSVEDVVEVIGSAGDVPSSTGPAAPTEQHVADAHRSPAAAGLRSRLDELDSTARTVYDGMPARREITVDELAVSCALSVLDVIRNLPVLELAGLVECTREGFRRTVRR